MTNICCFSGGRGSQSIALELTRVRNIKLKMIINGYDDGKSTGEIRRIIPDFLGPSDFRKVMSALTPPTTKSQMALSELMEFRLDIDLNGQYEQMYSKLNKNPEIKDIFEKINQQSLRLINKALNALTLYINENEKIENKILIDMSVGNLIFAGFYLLNGKSFEKTLSCVSELLDIDCEIYSATEGGGEFTLVAVLEDGEIIWTEAEIVEKRHNKQIIEIACVKTNLIPDLRWRERGISSASEKTQLIIENSIVPAISVGAKAAIEQADVIIYPPGTQFSSLLPSYLICRDAIKKSQARRKILFCNLECDNDIQNMVWKDILELVLKYSKDSNNEFSVTDICIDRKSVLNIGDERFFKNAYIHRDYFESKNKAGKHSGIMARLYINNIYYQTNDLPTYKFISTAPNGAYKQTALIENFIDNISKEQNEIVLQNITVINNDRLIHHIHNDIIINNINTWLKSPDSDYLIIFSFDGIYDAIDVLSLVSSLKNNMASVAVGNRFTSIKRLNHARKVVYNDVPLNKILSKIGGALVRMLFSKRTLTDLADPMTGLIVISRVEANRLSMVDEKFDTTTGFLMRVVEKGGAIVSQDINFLPLRGLRSQGKITQGLRILREIVLK